MRITLKNLKNLARSRKKWTERQVDKLYQIYRKSHFGAGPRTPRRDDSVHKENITHPTWRVGQQLVLRNVPHSRVEILSVSPYTGDNPGFRIYTIKYLDDPSSGVWHTRGHHLIDMNAPARRLYSELRFGAGFTVPIPRTPPRGPPATRVSPHWPLSFAIGEEVVLASHPNTNGQVINIDPHNGGYTVRFKTGPMIGDDNFYWHYQLKKKTPSVKLLPQLQFGTARPPSPSRPITRRIQWPRYTAGDFVSIKSGPWRRRTGEILDIVVDNPEPNWVQYRVQFIIGQQQVTALVHGIQIKGRVLF